MDKKIQEFIEKLPQATRDAIAADIGTLRAGEASARHDQLAFLAKWGEVLPQECTDDVKEISGDEAEHEIKYQAWQKYFDGISAAPDGASEALEVIADGITDERA